MKKFLVVLMLLIVASAYSVGGSMYMRYNANGSVTATEWGLLDDLRVGRRGTGFDLNFDSFTLSYKLRSATGVAGAIVDLIGSYEVSSGGGNANTIGTPTASSPGYVQLSGLRVGPANMAIGGSWWHYDYTKTEKYEPTSGTGYDYKATAGYNVFAFDFAFDLPIGDTMRLHIDPWDKVNVSFAFGDADVKWASTTNKANASSFAILLPVHFNMNFDVVGIEIFPKISFSSSSSKQDVDPNNSAISNKENNSSSLTAGLMVRVDAAINELLGAFAHVGIVYSDGIDITKQNNAGTEQTITNSGPTSMEAPIFAGLTVKPAGPVLLTLGVGYLVEISETSKVPFATTNQPSGGLIGEYGYFDEHGYKNPFLRFAGSAKFASDCKLV